MNPKVLAKSAFSGYARDIHYEFTFCPKESGIYDVWYDGTYDSKYELIYSVYRFNETRQKPRSFSNLSLRAGVCYPVVIVHSVMTRNIYGNVWYKFKGVTKLFSADDSFSCSDGWCQNGGEFPECAPPPTTRFTAQSEQRFGLIIKLLLCMMVIG